MTGLHSIVIPIFNEEETIPELWARLSTVIAKLEGPVEVLFVDDGSSDKTLELLARLASEMQHVKVLSFSRNFGHQAALSAGLDHAQGQTVTIMDGDLQDLPEAIPDFIAKWKEGFDVVYAVREKRKEGTLKRGAFKLFYRLQTRLTSVTMPTDAGIFGLMDRKVVEVLREMPERCRYLPGMRAFAGFHQTGILVERGARHSGEPRVSTWKLIRLALDGIFAFSTVPLRMISVTGFIISMASFLIAMVGLYHKVVLQKEFLSWHSGLSTTFFLGGIQLLAIGILGEYLGRIYEEVKQRPRYVLARQIGFAEEKNR